MAKLKNLFKFNPQGDAPHLRQLATDQFLQLKPPSADEMKIQLEQMVQQGLITPEMADTYLINGTSFDDLHEDPAVRDAQMRALTQLQDYSDDGGTAQTNARLAGITDEMRTAARGTREAVIENARALGVGGSGLDVANQMLSSQEAATNANRAGVDAAAEAEKRAMDAVVQSGSLGGQVRGQDYQVEADRAKAADAIERFNVANRQDVQGTNVAARNRAQELNLGEKQRVADSNVTSENENRVRDSNLKQQQFENELKRASGVAGSYDKMAEDELAKERSKGLLRQKQVNAGAKAVASYYGY